MANPGGRYSRIWSGAGSAPLLRFRTCRDEGALGAVGNILIVHRAGLSPVQFQSSPGRGRRNIAGHSILPGGRLQLLSDRGPRSLVDPAALAVTGPANGLARVML